MSFDETVDSLREALRHSPENVPLRRHLAELLLKHGFPDQAETEFRAALNLDPDHAELKLGLAEAFARQGKGSEAMVLVEDLLKRPDTPPAAYVLHARILLRAGDVERAVRQYRRALDEDPALADEELSERLGVDAGEDDEVSEGRVRARHEDTGGTPGEEPERPRRSFAAVGCTEEAKEQVRKKIILPLTHPELFEAYGKKVGGGLLMYGPPGCGKTHLARATAGEVKAAFLSVGLHDVLDMWIGQSERNLHALFEQARAHRPCVLFFDEVDALGASRADMRQSAGRQLINQFLSEMDGIDAANEGVLILAATNAPWHLDAAFRRPGRFDRVLFVPPPDEEARVAILRILLRGKPVADVDHVKVARKAKGFSGADLRALVDRAVEARLDEALAKGAPQPLRTKDLLDAAKGFRSTTKEWLATARNYALYANQAGLYDDVLRHLDSK